MSLFGKMIPFKPDMKIPQEVKEVLEAVMVEAKDNSSRCFTHEGMLEGMYQDLEVVMFFEILTHLPGQYLEIFVNMNDQNVARERLDSFLHDNMPNAEKVFAMALSKFRYFYVGKTRITLLKILNSDQFEFQ